MPNYISHLGHNPALSLAEILVKFQPSRTEMIPGGYLEFQTEYTPEMIRSIFPLLGGQRLIAQVYSTYASNATQEEELKKAIEQTRGESKYQFALSANKKIALQNIGMDIKKYLTKEGISARCINKNNEAISPALAKKERIGNKSFEWHILEKEDKTQILAQTLVFQDIDSYSDRDMGKARDMQVGMLPPKLSQILINLAGMEEGGIFYDPFCGLGTLPIEAMRYNDTVIFASDVRDDLAEMTHSNLLQASKNAYQKMEVFTRDATKPSKEFEEARKKYHNRRLTVATEGYLGPIIRKFAQRFEIEDALKETTQITHDFLRQLTLDLKKGDRACICMPCWFHKDQYSYIPQIISLLGSLGLSITRIEHKLLDASYTSRGSLIYRRPSQSVGREIFILTKK